MASKNKITTQSASAPQSKPVSKSSVILSEQTQSEIATLREIHGLLDDISQNDKKILAYRTRVTDCKERTRQIDAEVKNAYRNHVEVKGTYNTSRVEKLHQELDLLAKKCASKSKRIRDIIFCIITVILVLASTIYAFVATMEDEMNVILFGTIFKFVAGGVAFQGIRKRTVPKFTADKQQQSKTSSTRGGGLLIFILIPTFIFHCASYVRMEEELIAYSVLGDVLCAVIIFTFYRIANAPYRAYKKLEKKYPSLLALDQAEEAKKQKEITAGLPSVINNVYPDVEEIKKKYLAIKKDASAFTKALAKLKADNANLQQKLDDITLLVSGDKNPVLVSTVIGWLESGKVPSLKEALRKWDYETEAKALQEDYFQCQLNITAEMAELNDDINRINNRISMHVQNAHSNVDSIEDTIDQFKRDASDKYGDL